jgi:hypothetical protein
MDWFVLLVRVVLGRFEGFFDLRRFRMIRTLSFFFALLFLVLFLGILVDASHNPYREISSLLVCEVAAGFFLMVGVSSPKEV